jgi:spermidine/putrescine ABC transporter ATP-binding subunit
MTLSAGLSAKALRLERVEKSFGAVTALQPLSVDIPPGKFVALLGPSGCGKSTTLRIVAGLERPDRGRVHLGDADITDVPCSRRGLGMVFQNYALFPHMNVAQNVGFGLRIAGLGRDEVKRRVREALDLVRLVGFDERLPAMLSGGQQQRVALARSLVTRPSVFLLDEPLGALDKNLRESMQFELLQLQRALGITTILVTHDQEEALTMSDLVIVMSEGRIAQQGTPEEVYDRPRTRFVAEFLGAANIFGVSPEAGAAMARLRDSVGQPLPCRVPLAAPSASRAPFLVAVRPERMSIEAMTDPSDSSRVLGTLAGHVFRGSSHLYEVRVPGLGAPVYVATQHRGPASFDAAPGQTVALSWPAESSIVLEDPVA